MREGDIYKWYFKNDAEYRAKHVRKIEEADYSKRSADLDIEDILKFFKVID